MVKKRYISILLPLTKNDILKGIQELKIKYENKIYFNDKLYCVIL